MSVIEENACTRMGQDSNQISPFMQCAKFGEPNCTPSQQIDLLGVKDDYFKSVQVNSKEDNSEDNFLQYWDKQGDNCLAKQKGISLEGPVGQVLCDFEAGNPVEDSFKSQESFDDENAFYNPDADSLEEFFGETPKNFEEIIDTCRGDNCHFNGGIEEDNIKRDNNYSRKAVVEETCYQHLSKKQRKRDAKLANKVRSDICFSNNLGRESFVKRSKSDSTQLSKESNSGLIIKIRAGKDVLANEKFSAQEVDKDLSQSSMNDAGSKVTAPRSSCSASTIGNERIEEKSSKFDECSVSFIELENDTKIFCRSIGPLKANERKQKVLHYLEKKRSRKWHKRINYNTRKQVADIRPRYKGRFVTTEQYEEFKEIERKKNEEKLKQKVFKIERIHR
ncbi:unnamed protein product [Moneuplotes crassus]|uniref:CCT domain-containing protein n=1 Tax=Euplotes crassus TaxID=5936 RepID=A0AAD1X6T6_EUPCR|nr:unnamed protein product [Moneuplotes crassus]